MCFNIEEAPENLYRYFKEWEENCPGIERPGYTELMNEAAAMRDALQKPYNLYISMIVHEYRSPSAAQQMVIIEKTLCRFDDICVQLGMEATEEGPYPPQASNQHILTHQGGVYGYLYFLVVGLNSARERDDLLIAVRLADLLGPGVCCAPIRSPR